MKKSIVFVAFALLVFASCQKEPLVSENQEPTLRTITATFENNGTKTTLSTVDNKTPLWSNNDKIRILNATSHQDITLTEANIKNDKRTITFTTSLTGTLYAVYPASATTMGSCSDGKINFTIPAFQDGTFASANICVAKSSSNDETNKNCLVFSNATSVLEFSQDASTTGVLSVRVEAANAIAGPMTVAYNTGGTFTLTTSSLSGKLINARPTEVADKYYVAVAPVTTGKIEFEYQKDIKVATITTEAGKTLESNNIYECPSMDGKTYEVKTGTIDGKDYVQIGHVKWATKNFDALTINDIGSTYNFVQANSTSLGGSWRMPTKDDFVNLDKASGGNGENGYAPSYLSGNVSDEIINRGRYWVYANDNSLPSSLKGTITAAGLLFSDGDGHYLFFPADTANDQANCWSSTENTGSYGEAYFMSAYNKYIYPQNSYLKTLTFSVRPVSD